MPMGWRRRAWSGGAGFGALVSCAFFGCVSVGGLSGGGDAPDGGESDGRAPDGVEAGTDAATQLDSSPTATAVLTITRSGNGGGNVSSQGVGIDCGETCAHPYARNALVTLTAIPLTGSAFIGWGMPCSGTGKCAVTMTTDLRVDAAFGVQFLDIDGNRAYEEANDATLVSRYLFGTTGSALTQGAIGVNATRSTPADVLLYLEGIKAKLDVDGNGEADALTDGILIQRYMKGIRGDMLTKDAIGVGATRTTSAQIEAYLKTLTP